MNKASAKEGLQNDRKQLQIAFAAAAGLVLLILASNYIDGVFLAVGVGVVVAAVVWKLAEQLRERREAEARAMSFAYITGPVLIASNHPAEPVNDVTARAEEFREQLRLSGNPYANQIPIVCFPYQPMLYGVGQLTSAWNIYQREASEHLHAKNLQWAHDCPEPLKPIFLTQVMPQPQQTSV